MGSLRRHVACSVVCVAIASSIWPAIAGELGFPFDRELVLDAAPMRGSKRVPILEIAANGAASIDLWCNSVRGKANVGDGSITIMPESAVAGQCAPEQRSVDENLLAALVQVTNWRRRGDVIELIGTTTLRFRLVTN